MLFAYLLNYAYLPTLSFLTTQNYFKLGLMHFLLHQLYPAKHFTCLRTNYNMHSITSANTTFFTIFYFKFIIELEQLYLSILTMFKMCSFICYSYDPFNFLIFFFYFKCVFFQTKSKSIQFKNKHFCLKAHFKLIALLKIEKH